LVVVLLDTIIIHYYCDHPFIQSFIHYDAADNKREVNYNENEKMLRHSLCAPEKREIFVNENLTNEDAYRDDTRILGFHVRDYRYLENNFLTSITNIMH
jgi:hypothetical protein